MAAAAPTWSGSINLTPAQLGQLQAAVGADCLLTDPADCWTYGYDNSRLQGRPLAVVLAESSGQIQRLLTFCIEHQLPLIPRGRGTGTTGAAVPDQGGLVLSFERMNQILHIDPANRLARVQPGLTNQALQDALRPLGFFWPPDPTSAAYCSIGGNLAYNSAGPRAVKYGTPRENTLGLSAVIGTGQVLHTGVETTKGVVGYDLTRLLIGSEGTLGLITEATLKLSPLSEAKRTLQAVYKDMDAAAQAVSAIMAQPVIPCALEMMDSAALRLVRRFSDPGLPEAAGALLMIEVDGAAAGLDQAAEALAQAASNPGLISVEIAQDEAQVKRLWKTRKSLSPALRNAAPKKINEDIVVPVSRIPELIAGLDALSRQHAIDIVNFGHAGNGNIHVNLMYDPEQGNASERAQQCLSDALVLVLRLHGTLSGEHGIGLAKRDFVAQELDPVGLEMMQAIKRQFDPHNILNPGKGLPQ